QKIEDPRYLYWCDRLGLLVWEEMPSAYAFSSRAVEGVTAEWVEAIARDRSHPCIVTWVPFNESWGLPDLPRSPQTRAFSQALYHLTKALDPTRPVIGNDGWEQVETDLLTVHDYTDEAEVILERYGTAATTLQTLRLLRPGGRRLFLGPLPLSQPRPVLLTEFGGIAYLPGAEEEGWGYSRVRNEEGFIQLYSALLEAIHACENLAGFCYTQLTDTYQEVNGILTADRKFKADPDLIASATRGPRSAQEQNRDPHPHPFGYSRGWLKKHGVNDQAVQDLLLPFASDEPMSGTNQE
ncbi:MAG TPA: glycoside hydrolase family 2 TIM barrel-domain containing protein, partial [Chthoniobacterales bacterium]